jgi:hypothetical protein
MSAEGDCYVRSDIMRAILRDAMADVGVVEAMSVAVQSMGTADAIIRDLSAVCAESTVTRLQSLGWSDTAVSDRKDFLSECVLREADAAASAIAHQFAALLRYPTSIANARGAMAGLFALVGGRAADEFDAALRESAGLPCRKPEPAYSLPEGFTSQHLGSAFALAIVQGCSADWVAKVAPSAATESQDD